MPQPYDYPIQASPRGTMTDLAQHHNDPKKSAYQPAATSGDLAGRLRGEVDVELIYASRYASRR